MATGDQADMAARLRALLPNGWFGDDTPILDTVLAGIGSVLASIYSLITFVAAQTRLATAQGAWLDLFAYDYFGGALTRRSGEVDTSYRARIKLALVQPSVTRAAMVSALTALTGRAPVIFEPWNPLDAGSYASASPLPVLTWQGNGAGSFEPSTAIEPPVAGTATFEHTAPLTGDDNCGAAPFTCTPGDTATATVYVWIPAGYTGTPPALTFEGGGSSTRTGSPANPGLTGQWQTLTVAGVLETGSSNLVIRSQATGATETFYSAALGLTLASVQPVATGLGYGVAGGYGSLALPAQAFITAFRQVEGGIASVGGYNGQGSSPPYAPGGYGVGAIEYVTGDMAGTQVSDSEIFDTVARTQAEGVTGWTKISN